MPRNLSAFEFTSEKLKTTDSIYDDIKNAFIATGDSPAQAEDKAFDILGLIAAGGTSLKSRFFIIDLSEKDPRNPAKISLVMISKAAPKLDSIMMEKQAVSFLDDGSPRKAVSQGGKRAQGSRSCRLFKRKRLPNAVYDSRTRSGSRF
jgi:hypothetical protein